MHQSRSLALAIVLLLISCVRPERASASAIPHPDRAGAEIEYFVTRPAGRGPWPTIVFLHGHQPSLARPGGKVFVDWGVLDRYAQQGILAAAVSLPGYGGSTGPEDFAGPFTQDAVKAVLAKLESDGDAAPDKALIEGISLGAVTGALVAAHDPRIAGVILISGLYDLPAFLDHPKSPGAQAVRTALVAQTGGSEEALRSRSALLLKPPIRTAALILNGAKDDRTDPSQARALADAINAQGGRARVHVYEAFGHEIPVKARQAEVDAFITETLKR